MKAVTANRLEDGAAVYLGDNDQWTLHLNAAAHIEDDIANAVLKTAQSRNKEVIEAHLMEIDAEGAPAGRKALRETIRKSGPTVRAELGR